MSAFLNGLSGLALTYAAVEAPLAITLINRGVGLRGVLASNWLAAPLTLATGVGMMVVAPFLREFGIASGSF